MIDLHLICAILLSTHNNFSYDIRSDKNCHEAIIEYDDILLQYFRLTVFICLHNHCYDITCNHINYYLFKKSFKMLVS